MPDEVSLSLKVQNPGPRNYKERVSQFPWLIRSRTSVRPGLTCDFIRSMLSVERSLFDVPSVSYDTEKSAVDRIQVVHPCSPI